jgi:CubicO group peptidase (beta-lactamase class C family)
MAWEVSGDPPRDGLGRPPYEGVAERTLGRVADIGTKIRADTQHKYSNLAYQLLGEIVARASRMPYPRYVKEAILDPLAMSATGFEPLPPMLAARRAAVRSRLRTARAA